MSDFEKAYYEAPEFWKEGVLTNNSNSLRIQHTIKILPDEITSLLDVGCGNGVFVNSLLTKKPNIKIDATDRSAEAIKYVKADSFISDITSIPKPDKSYDCITCLQVLEHIPVPAFHKSISELARVSKKWIVVSVPFNENIEVNATKCPQCKSTFNSDLHVRSFTKTDLDSLFQNQGFKLEEFQNVNKSRRYFGSEIFYSTKNLFNKQTVEKFESPICPICGFENYDFNIKEQDKQEEVQTSTINSTSPLKKLLKNIVPTYEIPGYWAICLFKKH